MKTSRLEWILGDDDSTIVGGLWGTGALSVLVDPGRRCHHRPYWVLEGDDITGHGGFWGMMTSSAVVNPGR